MKSLLKAAALLVVAMPLYAADMGTTTTTTGNGAVSTTSTIDCTQMSGDMQSRCMSDMDKCNGMTSMADKKVCMDKMKTNYMNKNMPKTTEMKTMQ
jgi:hypothetical protein